ncbi:MAG: WbuC family cupin fold metalloprotein [Bacteroidales bacterium]
MIHIDQTLLDRQKALSRESKRGRVNYNFHFGPADPLQRMLNTMQPGTYLQPHKHENPDKREVFIVLTGKLAVVEFDDDGQVSDYMVLDPSTGNPAAEIGERRYHTVICLEPDTVIYELKDGPYDPANDKNFASWAPAEGEPGCDEWLSNLAHSLGL